MEIRDERDARSSNELLKEEMKQMRKETKEIREDMRLEQRKE